MDLQAIKMKCPVCGSDNHHVAVSRPTMNGHAIYRYRQCKDCHKCWGTYEVQLDYFDKKAFKQLLKDLGEW